MAAFSRINLNEFSWIDKGTLPDSIELDFETIWGECPKERGKLNIYGKQVTITRFFKTYGHSYAFSGINAVADPIPIWLMPLLNYINSLGYASLEKPFNGILINWYPDGNSYISAHSDSEKGLAKLHSIVSVSLGAQRKFRIRSKLTKEIVIDIPMPDRSILVMGGATQNVYTHEVPKISGELGKRTGKRINITFRRFEN